MYPGLLSTLLPNPNRPVVVNRYDHRPFEQQERFEMAATYHQAQFCGEMQQSGRVLTRFYPAIHIKLTTSSSYLKNSKAKPRLKWEDELQERFLQSLDALGGEQYATPKKILYMMNVIGLTLSHLKSHLQKYRTAQRSPLGVSHTNLKKKSYSVIASLGHCGSSISTKKSGANKLKAGSSKAWKGSESKSLKIQGVDMAIEVRSKTWGNEAAPLSTASRKGKEPAIAPSFASRKGKEPAVETMGNQFIGESSFSSSREQPGGNDIIFSLTNSNGKELAIEIMGNQIDASSFAITEEKELAIMTMDNEIVEASAHASPSRNEATIKTMGNHTISGASTFASVKVVPAFSSETKSYPFRPNIFDIQIENYYPIHYSREKVKVRSCSAVGTSVKEQYSFCQPLGQSSFSTNLAYLNQYSIPGSNSSFGQAEGNRIFFSNYQMNTSSSFSSIFEKSMDAAGSHLSSLFGNTSNPSESFSSMFENSINTGLGFSSTYGKVNTGSSLSSPLSDLMNIEPSFSSMLLRDPILSFSSMLAAPYEPDSSFPSMIPNPIVGPSSSLLQMIANPVAHGSTFSSSAENPMGLSRSSFSPMVSNSMEQRSAFPSVITNPTGPSSSCSLMVTGLSSRFSPMNENPMGTSSSLSPVVADSIKGSSFPLMLSNPTGPNSNFFTSGVVYPPKPSSENPVKPDSSFLSMLTYPMKPDSSFFGVLADPIKFGSSFSTVAVNSTGHGSNSFTVSVPFNSSFSSRVENPTDSNLYFSTTFASTSDSSMGIDFNSLVLENSVDLESNVYNPNENGTVTSNYFNMDSGYVFHGITGIFP